MDLEAIIAVSIMQPSPQHYSFILSIHLFVHLLEQHVFLAEVSR